jgi:hypothetical protein
VSGEGGEVGHTARKVTVGIVIEGTGVIVVDNLRQAIVRVAVDAEMIGMQRPYRAEPREICFLQHDLIGGRREVLDRYVAPTETIVEHEAVMACPSGYRTVSRIVYVDRHLALADLNDVVAGTGVDIARAAFGAVEEIERAIEYYDSVDLAGIDDVVVPSGIGAVHFAVERPCIIEVDSSGRDGD